MSDMWPYSLIDWGMVLDWVGLVVRWTHVVAAVAWIGSSFYFIALDAGLKPDQRLDRRVSSEAWQVHGGGFYQIQKYTVAPEFLPPHLTCPGFSRAPKGVMFDTPARIAMLSRQIYALAVKTHGMPLTNITRITEAERGALGAWIADGSKAN
jgi:uncharacterized membrane protein